MSKKKQQDEDNGFAEWGGYMGAKVQKLQQQFRAEAANNPFKKSDLFSGISIHVNGLTNPTADELKRIMMTHGGFYDTYHRPGATTFIVAQNLPDVKIRAMASSKKLIISPDWIVDCVKEERLLDYSKYLLYTNCRGNQPKIAFAKLAKNESGSEVKENNNHSLLILNIDGNNKDDKQKSHCSIPVDIQSFVDDEEDLFADDDSSIAELEENHISPGGSKDVQVSVLNSNTNKTVESQNLNGCIPMETHSFMPAEEDTFDEKDSFIAKPEENNTHTGSKEEQGPLDTSITRDLQFFNEQMRQTDRKTSDAVLDTTCSSKNISISTTSSSKTALTAVDPNFLAEFYNNSRLHHIATLGASFKNHITMLRDSSNGSFPGRVELCAQYKTIQNGSVPVTIMHIDMDCFFVSVGLRERPHLRGQPVAVTHSKGGSRANIRPGADPQKERAMYADRRQMKNGSTENRMDTKTKELDIDGTDSLAEIASCSYEARRMGLKNGMFVGAALKLCPNLKTIPYDFEQYKEVAHSLYNTLAKYTLDIEAVSCDEMYVDLQSVLQATGLSAEQFVTHIRAEIQALTGCPCSAGVGSNRLQARMATKQAKPNGQFFLHPNDVEEYFSSIPISDLPGVGYTTTQKLNQFHWTTCNDIRDISLAKLQAELGKKLGETLQQYCKGIDTKPLVFGQVRKSVSAEVNYGIRFSVEAEFDAFLQQLCAEVHSRLTEIRHRGKSVTLKLMVRSTDAPIETAKFMGHGVCDNVTKTTTLADFTNDAALIERTVFAIKNGLGVDPQELRGVGIQIGKLDSGGKSEKDTSNRLKAMFKVAAQRNVTGKKLVINESEVFEPRRQLRSQRANSIPTTKPAQNHASKTGRKPGAANSRGVGRGSKRQASVTDLLVNRGVSDSSPDIQLDLTVLAELPDEIREEALRDFRQNHKQTKLQEAKKKTIEMDSLCGLDKEFLDALPEDIRAEVVRDQKVQNQRTLKNAEETKFKETNNTESIEIDNSCLPAQNEATEEEIASSANVFMREDWKNLLRDWVDSVSDNESGPISCDTEAVSEFAMDMVRRRKINELYLCFRYFFRIISEKQLCVWHRVYKQIVAAMQTEMQRTYGSRLQVKSSFDCSSCA